MIAIRAEACTRVAKHEMRSIFAVLHTYVLRHTLTCTNKQTNKQTKACIHVCTHADIDISHPSTYVYNMNIPISIYIIYVCICTYAQRFV